MQTAFCDFWENDFGQIQEIKISACVLCKKAVDKLRHLCYTIPYESVEGNGTFRRSFFAENRCHRLRAAAKAKKCAHHSRSLPNPQRLVPVIGHHEVYVPLTHT